MKSSKLDDYPGYAPPCRRRVWPYFVVFLLVLGVTCCVLLIPVVVLAMATLNGLGEFFSSLGLLLTVLWLIPMLADLLWLVQTGQYIQAAMRVLGAISWLRNGE